MATTSLDKLRNALSAAGWTWDEVHAPVTVSLNETVRGYANNPRSVEGRRAWDNAAHRFYTLTWGRSSFFVNEVGIVLKATDPSYTPKSEHALRRGLTAQFTLDGKYVRGATSSAPHKRGGESTFTTRYALKEECPLVELLKLIQAWAPESVVERELGQAQRDLHYAQGIADAALAALDELRLRRRTWYEAAVNGIKHQVRHEADRHNAVERLFNLGLAPITPDQIREATEHLAKMLIQRDTAQLRVEELTVKFDEIQLAR